MADLLRCWLGYPLPPALMDRVKEAQMQIKRRAGSDAIRWLPPGEIALLLVTIGEVAPATLLRVGSVVEQVVSRHARIALSLSGAGGSPNMTMPKTAWFGIGGETERLKKMRQELAVCVRPLVTAIDEKEFEPVVEIGLLRRFEERARSEMGRAIKVCGVGEMGTFELDAVHVLASRVTPAGPTLGSLKAYPLT